MQQQHIRRKPAACSLSRTVYTSLKRKDRQIENRHGLLNQ